MLGRITLPANEVMAADSREWVTRELKSADAFDEIDFQAAYILDLLEDTDYPAFDVASVADIFKQWEHDKQADILGYRNKSYRSTQTGTLAPVHHTPWMDAMDDSLETFLQEKQPEPEKESA
jgi:trimethylamine monooxygenase